MSNRAIIVDYNNSEQGADLVELLNCYASDAMGGGKALSEDINNKLCAELAKVPNAFSIIIYVEDKPAALVNCFQGFSTFKCKPLVNIHDLAVHPEFRGQGLSQQLLQEVENEAIKRGCCKVTLEVLSGNKVARNSYVKFGYNGYELDPEAGKAEFWEKPI